MTNLDNVLKSRDITFPTKVHKDKAMVFPVVIYGYDNWIIKKVKWQRVDAFELWCWRRLLRVPWIARRSNQSFLKEINPEYSWEGLTLKLKLQHHLMWRTNSLEKTLMLGKIDGKRRWGWQRMRWLDDITQLVDMNLSEFQETVKDREAWCVAVHGITKSWKQLSNWTTTCATLWLLGTSLKALSPMCFLRGLVQAVKERKREILKYLIWVNRAMFTELTWTLE